MNLLIKMYSYLRSSDYDARPRIPLLQGTSNYAAWKSKIEMVLIREGLWKIIAGRYAKPEPGDIDALAKWDEEAEKATATIFLYLSENAENRVKDLRDPILVWKTLEEAFNRVGFAARYNLWQKLFSVTPGHTGVVAYLNEIRGVGIQLKDSGATIPDELLVTIALQGLRKEYETVVSVLTCGKEQPTFESLEGLLNEQSARIEVKRESSGEHSFEAAELECWHCGKKGHKRERCFQLHPELKGPSTGPLPTPSGGRGFHLGGRQLDRSWRRPGRGV